MENDNIQIGTDINEILKLMFEFNNENKLVPNPFVLTAFQAIIDLHIKECVNDADMYKQKYEETRSWRYDDLRKRSDFAAVYLRKMFNQLESGYDYISLYCKFKLFLKPPTAEDNSNVIGNTGTTVESGDRDSGEREIHGRDSGSDRKEGTTITASDNIGSTESYSGISEGTDKPNKLDEIESRPKTILKSNPANKSTRGKKRKVHV